MMTGFASATNQLFSAFSQWTDYYIDSWQRNILFWDVMRERGNNYLYHDRQGNPPVLIYDYETLLDAREFERPVNYALLQVTPLDDCPIDPNKRPFIVIDPRAGHGPGIGGSKEDSIIGNALRNGFPVYFVSFFHLPEPSQTLQDVIIAQTRFIDEVISRHPESSQMPYIVGNCQAGWATAILAAANPDKVGTLVINGAPLSYWAGVEGKNPMRYVGGLAGGMWPAALVADLGNNRFDGANLVANFENLNPANTIWNKYYNLYKNIDKEVDRFLEFEKWWGGFYYLSGEEIRSIVGNLFVGNKLQHGDLILDSDDTPIELKNIDSPVVVFASKGDNITPPQQALNWITKVYQSDQEIREMGRTLVYLVHEAVGHLGIFVSSDVARKEHAEIIGVLDGIDYLPPGLWEMILEEKHEDDRNVHWLNSDYKVRFEARTFDDMLSIDDVDDDDAAFENVSLISEANDLAYSVLVSPVVKSLTNSYTATVMNELHPLRQQRKWFSDANLPLLLTSQLVPSIREYRIQADTNNLYLQMEQEMSANIELSLDLYRDGRDIVSELLFKQVYESFPVKLICGNLFDQEEDDLDTPPSRRRISKKKMLNMMEDGDFADALIRINLAIRRADPVVYKRALIMIARTWKKHPKLKERPLHDYLPRLKKQSQLLDMNEELALTSLKKILWFKDQRREALKIAEEVASAASPLTELEQQALARITSTLGV